MAQERYRSILLFGAPGVGKGTQGRILHRVPGFFHLASGDVFRSLDRLTDEGREAFSYISQGELVPDDLTIRLCMRALERYIAEGRFQPAEEALVLDGMPRTVRQAEILDQHLRVLKIINLVVPDVEQLVRRIKGRSAAENRQDDADEQVIRHRFEVYRRQSEPVLKHYPPHLVAQIDATQRPAAVLHDILGCIVPVLYASEND